MIEKTYHSTFDPTAGIGTDYALIARALADCEPEIAIHMAAQALVRPSYTDPLGTFATNVMGTANVLARELRIPVNDLAAACELLRGCEPRPIDLGCCNGRRFSLMAGIGFVFMLLAFWTAYALRKTRDTFVP